MLLYTRLKMTQSFTKILLYSTSGDAPACQLESGHYFVGVVTAKVPMVLIYNINCFQSLPIFMKNVSKF